MRMPNTRLALTLVTLVALARPGGAAEYRTANFVVEADSDAVAHRVAVAAERHRRALALAWLGRAMPDWDEPCPIRVNVEDRRPGGATSFAFQGGQVLGQKMNVQGPLDRVLVSVLPHEVTHTVFAHHFRRPLPRWADEGGAILCEDAPERRRHAHAAHAILRGRGRALPLRRLFVLEEYPDDVLVLYAQGYSVTNYLVAARGRRTFLAFVKQGQDDGWDEALKRYYGFAKVEELETAWRAHLRMTEGVCEQSAKAGELLPPPRPDRGTFFLPAESSRPSRGSNR
jgi:hypothetical protein